MKRKENIKIFIVDDQPVFLQVLSGLLKKAGYSQVQVFGRPEDCLNNLNLYPDIIFTDYNMDGMDGIALLKKIKEYNNEIKVIFTTGTEDIAVAMEAMKSGALDFLLKSNVNKKELNDLFRKINITAIETPEEYSLKQDDLELGIGF